MLYPNKIYIGDTSHLYNYNPDEAKSEFLEVVAIEQDLIKRGLY